MRQQSPPVPRRLPAVALVAATALVLAGTGCPDRPPEPSKPVVAVTVAPQAWFVEQLAGDYVDVVVMIPPGASHATYEPSIAQMRAVSEAAVYVKIGHPGFSFEKAWLERLIDEREDLVVVDGSGGISCPGGDPHVWLSPGVARVMARAISAALAPLIPAAVEKLPENLERVLAEIEAVDRHNREMLADDYGERFLVFHPAWGCFARQYGLVQVSIEEGEKEPSPRALARLIDDVRKDGVRVIFVQPQFPQRAAEEVARAIGADVVVIDPLARDWPAIMRDAATAIDQALRKGDIPL